jgi:hypothetical protein
MDEVEQGGTLGLFRGDFGVWREELGLVVRGKGHKRLWISPVPKARDRHPAQKPAEREDRTISELFREALRRYISADPEWDALLRRTQAEGTALGVDTEADVERLWDEFRQGTALNCGSMKTARVGRVGVLVSA